MHRALVVSELYPPDIGGSAELLGNIYDRLGDVPVTVLTHDAAPERDQRPRVQVVRESMRAPYWGLLRSAGLEHHIRRASRLKALSADVPTVVHTARALPEGVDAWLARRFGGSSYACWAHGEDIASASLSREFAFLMRRVYRCAGVVIANSHNTAAMLGKVDPRWTHIDVVHPGVDATRFRPNAGGARELRERLLEGADLLLLTVGRLQRRKGHDLVLQALRAMGDAGRRVRYAIAGDGGERRRLESLAQDLGVSGQVTFLGAVSGDMLPACYAAADIFVHPNRIDGEDVEGFGIVFLEAAAAGLPVIGGNSGGVPEAVERDKTALLVSGTDVEELRAAIGTLASSQDLRVRMGDEGRRRVERSFTWESAAARVKAIHIRLSSLGKGRAHP